MTTESKRELSPQLKKDLEALQTLRDEVRVRAHLGSMEVKRRWSEIEPHLEQLLQSAKTLGDASVTAVREALERLREIRQALKD